MRATRCFLCALLGLVALACDESHASLQITNASALRGADERVVVDVGLLAHEAMGENIGTYCTQVTFAGQTDPAEECKADLADGDTKTVRLISNGDVPEGAAITIRVRHAGVDIGRNLAAPPRR